MVGIVAVGDAWGGGLLAYMGAALVAYLAPLLMFPLAIWAVIVAWGWAWYWAFMIFLWPIALLIFGVSSALLFGNVLMRRMRRNAGQGAHTRSHSHSGQNRSKPHADVEVEADDVDVHDINTKEK